MNLRTQAGFTWIEFLVCLVVIGVLIALTLPGTSGSGLSGGRMTQSLSNMKQLQLATQQMALDGQTTGNKNLGWPGDTGSSFARWTTVLVQENYLSKQDLAKLLSAPGIVVSPDNIPTVNTTAVLVYAVSAKSPENTVFLSTANFTNTPTGGVPPVKSAKPYGEKGFIVFRKGGDGAILRPRQTGPQYTNIIGAAAPLCR